MAIFLKPTLINDGAWHGFLGYQADSTRSPSLWVNFNGCDVGFCDCSGATGGIAAWENGDGPNGWVTPTPSIGDFPVGECAADDQITQACTTAGCCDCTSANTGNSGDGVSGNGMHWDTRTVQEANGNEHGGQRFAGVVDNYFANGRYTHVVWTKVGQVCRLYKNGGLTDTTVCPTHVDLHSSYEIGHVDNFFQGVIDEVSFYSFALTTEDIGPMYSLASSGMTVQNTASHLAKYLFNGNAQDASGFRNGIISGGTSLTADRFGVANSAYEFDGIDDTITVPTPFAAADSDFSLTIWLKPTLMNDNVWHGFVGYQGDLAGTGTRSPSLWVNFNGCDIGFCDCSGDEGGITAWSGCPGGPYGGACILTPNTDMPEGICNPSNALTHQCRTAGCCDCSTANTGNSGDGISGNGLTWDTRTTNTANGNGHGGARFAGTSYNV